MGISVTHKLIYHYLITHIPLEILMKTSCSTPLNNNSTTRPTPRGLFQTWRSRMAYRRELARLDSHLLADAGISEMDRYKELSKPFWR